MSETSYDEVKASVIAIVKRFGRGQAIALLDHYGVKRAYELPESHYGKFVAHADRLMAFLAPAIPSKLASLKEPSCAEQEAIWEAKCQPAHVSHVEPEREPLEWNKPTPFDSFKGFVVSYDTGAMVDQPVTHALQRMNDGTDALHGSAFLRG